MSLTGPIFLDGILTVTVVAVIAVVVFWPQLAGPSAWSILGRFAALSLVIVLVLLTAATQLNAHYLFYSSWSDLQGAYTGHIVQTTLHRGARGREAANMAVPGYAAPALSHVPALTEPVSPLGLVSFSVHGPLSGLTGTVVVQVPADYSSPAEANTTYPVIEAFQGYPGSPLAWPEALHTQQYIDQAVSAHELREPLLVSPQLEFPVGVDTEGVDGGPNGPAVETWLARDVPTWVGQHFRVERNRNAWTTIGYSAGAWVAAMATVLHPAQYGAGIVMGGYFRPEFGPFYEPFPPGSPPSRRYDLARSVARHPPPVAIWVETSHADVLSYSSSAAFLQAVRAPTAVDAVVLRNAGHRMGVWMRLLPEALRWLGTTVQGFRP